MKGRFKGIPILLWVGLVLLGLAAAAYVYPRAEAERFNDLVIAAQRSAVAFEGATAALSGSSSDLDSPTFVAIKSRLEQLRKVAPGIRFVYLMRHLPETGAVIFLADSEPADSPDVSNPGDAYAESAVSPGLQSILRTGAPATEGPLTDSFGTWVTAYALVARDPAGVAQDVLGIDVDAAQWSRELLLRAGLTAMTVWFTFGIPLGFWTAVRQRVHLANMVRRLSVALDQSRGAVLVATVDGRIDYVNGGLCRQLGFGANELLGQCWHELPSLSLSRVMRAQVLSAIRNGSSWQGQWNIRRRDGSSFPAHGIISPVLDQRQTLTCIIAMFDDVSALKRAEEELLAAKEQAEAANAAKSSFLAMMSHEIRTPMNGVIGMTSLLDQSALAPEQREYVSIIRNSGESLLRIINDILNHAKIEAGRFDLDLRPFQPRTLLEETMLFFRAAAQEKQLELHTYISDDVPAAVIADGPRLRQILVNLVGNALKFTDRGRIELRAELLAADATRATLQFSVSDTGIGIRREKLGELFSPFNQLEASTARRYGGTGLGLSISKRLCELMGGSISVESEIGHGCVFRFTIVAEVVTGSDPAPEPLAVTETLATTASPAAGLRILLVEDNAVNALVALKMLRALGCSADHAHDGVMAVKMYETRQHDIILMDLQMPELNGWETTRQIRARGGDQPWIIALTAEAMESDRVACLAAGMDAYETKPLVLDRLAAQLAQAAAARSSLPRRERPVLGDVVA